ncbi:MAG: ABC transporter substrate-binding protein [Reyranellaceae bacterium]
MTRIGWLTAQAPASLAPYIVAFRQSLAERGLVEGKNLVIDYRYGDDDLGRVPALVEALVSAGVRLIVAQGAAVGVLARRPPPVPLVFLVSGDPVAAGLAESLARPKNNMTGFSLMAAELNGKRIQILRDIGPGLRRVALIGNPEHPGAPIERTFADRVAERLAVRLDWFPTANRAELATALARMKAEPPDAVSILADGFSLANREQILATTMDLRIPAVSGWRPFAEAGAVCTYGPKIADCYRRLAYFVERLLQGTKPADLPIEQPSQFELIVNQEAARRIAVAFPPALLAAADTVLDS